MNNVRVLVSRNKREGGYLGRYRSVYDRDYVFERPPLRRHQRQGRWNLPTLRQPIRLKDRGATPDIGPYEVSHPSGGSA